MLVGLGHQDVEMGSRLSCAHALDPVKARVQTRAGSCCEHFNPGVLEMEALWASDMTPVLGINPSFCVPEAVLQGTYPCWDVCAEVFHVAG